MPSITLHDVPDRLRSIRASLIRSVSSTHSSTSSHRESAVPSLSSSISSCPQSPTSKPTISRNSSSEQYIPPTPWEPTTNEPRRFNSLADFILRRKSEPSCKPRKTTEKGRAKMIAKWQPSNAMKYPHLPSKEHAEMLEAWTWENAGLIKPIINPTLDDPDHIGDDAQSCVSPRGSRRNSWSSIYWHEEEIRLRDIRSKPLSTKDTFQSHLLETPLDDLHESCARSITQQDGPLRALDTLLQLKQTPEL